MSKVSELINKLCPEGVPYVRLGDFCSIQTGRGITNKDTTEDGEYPVISGGIEPMGFYHEFNRNENTVTIARAGGAGYVNFIPTKFYLNDKCFSVIPKNGMNTKFLYYSLKNIEDDIISMKSTGTVPTVNTVKVSSIKVPVPPIEVQCEIVHILDSFTELIAELTTELISRKKQFDYYRESIFDNSDWTYCKLTDHFPFVRNGFVGTVTNYFTTKEEGVRYLEGTNIHEGVISDNEMLYVTKDFHRDHIKNELKEDDVLMVQSGHIGECAVVGKKYKGSNCHALIIMSNGGRYNSKFLVHYFHTLKGMNSLKPAITDGNLKHVLAGKMGFVKIPDISLDAQNRIVEFLDRFEFYCSDLQSGLPAEIKARKKQYEYYRNKLLTFKELKA